MPVSVALVELVTVDTARKLWPDGFVALVAKLEDAPEDRQQMLVIADWLQEHGEPLFEAAFRYVARRPEIELLNDTRHCPAWWHLKNVPHAVSAQQVECGDHWKSAAGPFAELALKIAEARKDLE